MNQEETLNINQIKFNQLLLDAHNQFQLRDMNQAIRLYEEALNCQEAGRDIDRMAIILANLGIIYFHNCDYKQATEKLLQAFNMTDRKNDFKCALLIKILGNLAIIKLIWQFNTSFWKSQHIKLNLKNHKMQYQIGLQQLNFKNAKIIMIRQFNQQYRRKFFSQFSQFPLQYQLFKELMYIYYRFQSFEAMGDGNFENLEQKYDGQSLACFYSSMGLNRELCGDMTLAFRYHQKALKLWQEQKENGFTVITLRRMLTIAQNERMDCKDYVQQLQKCMQSPELRGISPEILFKDCEKKLQCAREITTSLQKLEQQLNYQKNQQLLSQPLTVKQQDEFWKLALKLRLKRAIQFCYNQMTQQDAENASLLSQSIAQLEHSLKLLDQQQPYENYLQNLPFTKESVNIIKSHLMKFNRICLRIQLEPFLNYLYQLKQEEYQDQQNYQQPQFKQKLQSNQMYNQQVKNSNTLAQQKQFDQTNSQHNSLQSQVNYDYQNQQDFQSYHSTNDQQNYMVRGQNPTSYQNNQFQQFNNPLSSNFSQKNKIEQNDFQQQKQQTQPTYEQQPFKNSGQFGSQTMGFAGNNQQKTSNQQQLSSSQQQQQQANLKLSKSQLNQPQVKQGQMMAASITKSQKLKNVSLLNAAYRTVMLGDQLTKCNKSSNGRIERFFILANDGTFRWAQNSKHINDPKSVNSYSVSDIRGLLYGKATDVLRKSYNDKLEPWLCFSLVMKTRSMDFYTQELQINAWVMAMSEEIKRRNPSAFVITPGKMLWRKIKLILHWYFVDKKKKDKKKKLPPSTFVHLLYLYARNQCRLPQIQ